MRRLITSVLMLAALWGIAGCAPQSTLTPSEAAASDLTITPTADVIAGALTHSAPTIQAMTQNPLPTSQPTAQTPATPATPASTPQTAKAPLNEGGQQTLTTKPIPCKIDGAVEVYLVIEGQRRHIIDWATFESLGYKAEDIVPCGASASLPEGGPVTRLFKGAGDPVYLMELGYRHHIPDMTTFTALGLRVEDITALPDAILELWPLGVEVTPISASNGTLYKTLTISTYTIKLWHPTQGMFDFATISAPGQVDIVVPDVESIAELPADDITGEGNPDIVFLIRSSGSAHCCWGTVAYNLGATPVNVLTIGSPAYWGQGTGRGEFKDLNGDSIYEFVTYDPFIGPCSSGIGIMAVLRYDAGQRKYVGASPQFAASYEDEIAKLNASAQPGGPCYSYYVLVATLLYTGRVDDAKTTFDRLYTGTDAASDWDALKSAVEHGRYYVPGQ